MAISQSNRVTIGCKRGNRCNPILPLLVGLFGKLDELAPPLPITRHVHVQGWLPHSSPCYKINVDASWSKVPQSGFVSMVIRDAGGRFVATARYAILSLNVATAEVVALLHGGGLGSSLGCNSIIIESDSRESIDCLSRDFDSGS
ncbi:uncharacterized protein [Malus domestica]|uniref:uncharacterized protein n=1 Tax=Malus domestica TaxID=3750 RepID=UPI003975394F